MLSLIAGRKPDGEVRLPSDVCAPRSGEKKGHAGTLHLEQSVATATKVRPQWPLFAKFENYLQIIPRQLA